jgi:hypothetical protein
VTESDGNKDLRLDRLVTWGLQIVIGAVLSAGAWYANAMGGKVDALIERTADLQTQVAVLTAGAQDSASLRRELTALQVQVGALAVSAGAIEALRREVSDLRAELRRDSDTTRQPR